MKLVCCDGRLLEVRDVGPVIFRLRAGVVPIKVNGRLLLGESEARNLLRDLLRISLYEGGRVE